MITQAEALEYYRYDPETGRVYVRKHRRGGRSVGDIAGTKAPDGYWQIRFRYKTVKLHSLIWLMVYGEFGVLIDHANGDPSDNRLSNLRKCSVSQNAQNKRARRYSTSNGIKGISWDSKRCKWYACINVNGTVKFLGRHTRKEDAAAAYANAAKTYFGEFARF